MRRCGARRGTIGKLCLSNSIVSLTPALAFIHSYWFGKLLLVSHTHSIKLHLPFSSTYFSPGVITAEGISCGVEKWLCKKVLGGDCSGCVFVPFIQSRHESLRM